MLATVTLALSQCEAVQNAKQVNALTHNVSGGDVGLPDGFLQVAQGALQRMLMQDSLGGLGQFAVPVSNFL